MPLWKSVAYRRSPAIASPLKTPPETDVPRNDCVDRGGGGTPGFHPRIVPPSVANMKTAGPECPLPSLITKFELPLNTMPVGSPATPTTSGVGGNWATPMPLYSVETSVPLSATHHGEVALAAIPQEFTRFASVW